MDSGTLYCEAKGSAVSILHSDYPHDRRIRAYRRAIARCARRKRAMLADQDRRAGVWCDSRGKLHARRAQP
jgi:hypothetical protein